MKKLQFFRPDGTPTEYAVGSIINSVNGEVCFYELLGETGDGYIPRFKINGKELYQRILIRRCYPSVETAKAIIARWGE